MRVVLTAGGTREPIDDVRVIANLSTGRLGARVADALCAAGHEVHLLGADSGARPDDDRVRRTTFLSSAELGALLDRHVPGADAVIHAAAVSDWVPDRRPGKLASDAGELVLRLRRAPKLVDGLRELAPDAVLVGFKLVSGRGEDAMLAAARGLLERARLDLVVANDAARVGESDHEVVLVTADDVLGRAAGKARAAAAVVGALETLARRRREAGVR